MSGFFRGPSLFAHVLIVAVTLAVGVPLLAQTLQSRPLALAVGVAAAQVYGLGAAPAGTPAGTPLSSPPDDRGRQRQCPGVGARGTGHA